MRSATASAVGALILAVSSGGCLDPDAPITNSTRLAQHPLALAFKATYEGDDGSTLAIVLSEPRHIMDRDGQIRSATPLRVESTHGLRQTVWIDADLASVRHDTYSTYSPPDAAASWEFQGALPPLGFGYLHLFLPNGTARLPLGNQALPLHANLQSSPEGHRLEIAEPAPHPFLGLGEWDFTFFYNATGPLPVRMSKVDPVYSVGNFTLNEYRPGLPIKIPDRWPKTLLQTQVAGDMQLFAGSHEPLGGMGTSFDEALAFLDKDQPEAHRVLSAGGCVSSADAPFPPGTTSILGMVNVTRTFVFYFDIEGADGVATGWTVYVTSDVAGRREMTAERGEAALKPKGSCIDHARAAAPRFSGKETVDLADQLWKTAKGLQPVEGFSVNKDWKNGRSFGPQLGWEYLVTFGGDPNAPVTISYHQMYFLPAVGWVSLLLVPAETLADLDANGFPALAALNATTAMPVP